MTQTYEDQVQHAQKKSASNMPVSRCVKYCTSRLRPSFRCIDAYRWLWKFIDGYSKVSQASEHSEAERNTSLGQDTWSSSWAESPRNHGVDARTCDETWLVQCLNRKPYCSIGKVHIPNTSKYKAEEKSANVNRLQQTQPPPPVYILQWTKNKSRSKS